MRFIFVSFSQSVFPEIVAVADGLKSLGHEIVYWLGSSEPASYIDDHGQTGLLTNVFLQTLAQKITLSNDDFGPLADQEPAIIDLLQRMHPTEALPELERRYHLLLVYCKWLLQTTKPNVIVFRIVPNLPPVHFILYHFARAKGVKTILFCDTWVSRRVLAMTDYAAGVPELQASREQETTTSLADLSTDLQEYYTTHCQDIKAGVPEYMPNILRNYNFRGRVRASGRTLKKVWDLKLFGKMWRTLWGNMVFWFRSHLNRELPRSYRQLVSEPDYSKPFIYFPLHLQPEFSTNPLGGYFRDQLLALEILAASLPAGWEIYVKEHPAQWLLVGTRHHPYRPKDYYHTIARLPAVRLIPTTADSFKLIRQAMATATISGTAGWEAILRGKPALVFGHAWYQAAPGVFKITDPESCRAALAQIKQGGRPDQPAVLDFLKRLDENSFAGCLDLSYRVNSKYFNLTKTAQAEGILKSILKLL